MKAYDYVDLHAECQPDAEFAADCGLRITYDEARQATNRISRAIIAVGLKPGDRIAVVLKNSVQTVLLYLGALKAGVVPVPINFRLKPAQWLEICVDAEAKLLVCDAELCEEFDAFRGELPTVGKFVVSGGSRSGWIDLNEWIVEESTDAPRIDFAEDDDAFQIYTSGTTGKPRGVVLTHRAVNCCIEQLEHVVQFHSSDRFLLVMPLFHAAGIIAMLQAISGGASLSIQQGFVPADVVEALDSQLISVAMLAPTMIQTCLSDVSDIEERTFVNLRLIIYGASPINEQTLREAMRVFGCDFAQRYGSTETLCLTWLTPEDHQLALEDRPELLRSAGRPLPGVLIRVVDVNRRDVPTPQRGEFIVTSPALMRGYWKRDDESSFEIDGVRWLHTGDCGYRDADDYVYICDRLNDVIISGGENIYPHELENVLLSHSDICEAVVIGIPDDKWGEAVKAIVVPRDGAHVSEGQLISYCREHLAHFQSPHSVDIVSAIPRSPSGKVLRFKLREPYWKGHDRRI